MKNPLKRITSLFKPNPRRSGLDPDLKDKVDHSECDAIWPDGTWKFTRVDRRMWADLDGAVRYVLLLCWANEEFYAAEAASGRRLNPGQYSTLPTAIHKGWKPSEKVLKHVWIRERWCPKNMHYVVGQLQSAGRLAA